MNRSGARSSSAPRPQQRKIHDPCLQDRRGTCTGGKLTTALSRRNHMVALRALAHLLINMRMPRTHVDRVRGVTDARHFGVWDGQSDSSCYVTSQHRCQHVQCFMKKLSTRANGESVFDEYLNAYKLALPVQWASHKRHCEKMGIPPGSILSYPLVLMVVNTNRTQHWHTDALGRSGHCDLVGVLGSFTGGNISMSRHSPQPKCCKGRCDCRGLRCDLPCIPKIREFQVQSGEMYVCASKTVHHKVGIVDGHRCSFVFTIRGAEKPYRPIPRASFCCPSRPCLYCRKEPFKDAKDAASALLLAAKLL